MAELSTPEAFGHNGLVCNVPGEVWTEIVARSWDPFAIISLLSTCRDLHILLGDRAIWIAVLRAVCCQRALFIPSYPIADMSVARLKIASKRPYLFSQLLEENARVHHEPKGMVPVSRSEIDCGAHARGEVLFLVPGGRYIVRAHTGALEVWDLGPCDVPPLSQPILLAQVSIDFPNPDRYLNARLSVRMVDEDTLRIAFAYDTTRVHIYDIRPGDTCPSLAEIAAVSFDSASFHPGNDWDLQESCVQLQVQDNFAVMEIGDAYHAIVWHFGEGWYALGPKRKLQLHPKIVLSSGTVIEMEGPHGFSIWRATRDRLYTYPISDGQVINFSDALARVHDIPEPDRLPALEEFTKGRWHGSTYSLPNTSWSKSNEQQPITFDILMNSVIYTGYASARMKHFIRGHRHVMTLSDTGKGAAQWTVELKTSFDLPSAAAECVPAGGPHYRLGAGFRFAFGLKLFQRGREMKDGGTQGAWLALYTLPSLIPGAERGRFRFGDTPRNDASIDSDLDAPVQAKAALLLDHTHFTHPDVCLASGRVLHTEGEADRNSLTHAVYISDFLPAHAMAISTVLD